MSRPDRAADRLGRPDAARGAGRPDAVREAIEFGDTDGFDGDDFDAAGFGGAALGSDRVRRWLTSNDADRRRR